MEQEMFEWLVEHLLILAKMASVLGLFSWIRMGARKDANSIKKELKTEIETIKTEIVKINENISDMKKDIRSTDNRLFRLESCLMQPRIKLTGTKEEQFDD